jgi:hypothetical protein
MGSANALTAPSILAWWQRQMVPAVATNCRILSSLLFGLSAICTTNVAAQEALRLSLAGEQAAENRKKTASVLSSSDLQLWGMVWRFGAGLALEASDNVRLVSKVPEGDLVLRPQAIAEMSLPLTDKNTVALTLAGGYSDYLQHSQFNRWYLQPGSQISFDVYVGDFWLDLHDRISVLEDSYQDPTVVGIADYALLQNVAGISAVWDLNKATIKLGYDHVNYHVLSGGGQQQARMPDGVSEVFSSSLGYSLKTEMVVGLEFGGSLVEYASTRINSFFTRAREWNTGCFIQMRLSRYTSIRGSFGYDSFSPDAEGSRTSADFTGVYVQASLANRFNRHVELALTGGRNINFTLFGGTMDLSYAQLSLNWNLLRQTQLNTAFAFEHGDQLGLAHEHFARHGPSLSVGRELTRKLSATVRYQWFCRTSDLPERDYAVNIAMLDLRYQF